MPPRIREVDPRELRTPSSRPTADLVKLSRQIARFGSSTAGMPPLVAYEDAEGVLLIYDGVTRATRIAMLAAGTFVQVEVIGRLRRSLAAESKLGERLP